jgi:hypothetical protein
MRQSGALVQLAAAELEFLPVFAPSLRGPEHQWPDGAGLTTCAKSRIRHSFWRQMTNHEISFNTDLSEPIRTRADFTYKISPGVISIFDTGLGQLSITEDIVVVLRKIEYWHQGPITSFKIMCRTRKGFGTQFDGTAKLRPCSL